MVTEAAWATAEPFDVVILDLTIPHGMGGQETSERLLKINPDAKLIVASGYADQPIMANKEKFGFRGVLPKPFSKNDLASAINSILDEA